MDAVKIAYGKALFAVTVWGASFIAIKIILREVSPVTVVWLRFMIGVAVMGLIVVQRRQFALPAQVELPFLALLGGLGITFHQWLQSNGLVTSDASTTGWIIATGPVFMAILGWLFLKERLGPLQVGGILLAAFGVVLVVSKGDLASVLGGTLGVRGDWLILVSAPNWAVFSILSRRALQRHPAARMMLFVMSFGWLFICFQFLGGGYLNELTALSTSGWLAVVFLGVFCTGLAYVAWYDSLKLLPASQVGVFLYFEPLASVAVAALMLGEAITPISLIGGGVILLGVWLVNRRAVRRSLPGIQTRAS